jgi:hypothetical protein
MPQFQGCRDRIERATTHREALAKLWADWIDEDPYSVSILVQRDGTGSMFIEPRNPVPRGWAIELGEILYHLRAALDGAVYQCAVIESGQNPPPGHDRLEFPICATSTKFAKAAPQKIGVLSQECQDFIESLQPYNAPKVRRHLAVFNMNRNLAIVNDWARKDRHRTLHIIGGWASQASPKIRLPPGATLKYLHANNDGFLDVGREIATFAIEGYRRGMNVMGNPDLMIDVGVSEEPTQIAKNDTLGNRLTGMIQTTTFITLALEKLTRRASGTQI